MTLEQAAVAGGISYISYCLSMFQGGWVQRILRAIAAVFAGILLIQGAVYVVLG